MVLHSLFLLAQVVVPPVAETPASGLSGMPLWILSVAVTGLLTLLSWAVAKWGKKLSAEADGTIKQVLLAQLHAVVESVVARLNTTMKKQFDELTKDGNLSSEDAKKLADTALTEAKTLMGEAGLASLQKVFGWGLSEVDMKIRGVVEQKVVEAKVLQAQTIRP